MDRASVLPFPTVDVGAVTQLGVGPHAHGHRFQPSVPANAPAGSADGITGDLEASAARS